VLARFKADTESPPLLSCWAVGDNLNDLRLLRRVDQAFAIEPKSPKLAEVPGLRVIQGFEELLPLVPLARVSAARAQAAASQGGPEDVRPAPLT